MKKLLIIPLLLLSLNISAQFIDEDWTQAGFFIDPTLTDEGYQIGLELTKVMHWGYISLSTSRYDSETKNIGYSDVVASGGINWYMFKFNGIRYYAGARLGIVRRYDSALDIKPRYNLAGGEIGADFNLTRKPNHGRFVIGIRLWTDYREDQKNQFYGDSDGYKRGLITNNPLLQENGAIVFLYCW